MGKVIGILMFVAVMWFGMEVYNNGTGGAFGGVFARLGWVEETPEGAAPASTAHRVGATVLDAHAEADARRERLLAE